MQNFLVSFVAAENKDVIHRLLVRSDDSGVVSELAKTHLRRQGVPSEELSTPVVEAYGQARIENVEII
mgnify:FL=1